MQRINMHSVVYIISTNADYAYNETAWYGKIHTP